MRHNGRRQAETSLSEVIPGVSRGRISLQPVSGFVLTSFSQSNAILVAECDTGDERARRGAARRGACTPAEIANGKRTLTETNSATLRHFISSLFSPKEQVVTPRSFSLRFPLLLYPIVYRSPNYFSSIRQASVPFRRPPRRG